MSEPERGGLIVAGAPVVVRKSGRNAWGRALAVLLLGLCARGFAAAVESVDLDALPRNVIVLPNDTRAVFISYADRNWREADPQALATADEADKDICFEAKFEAAIAPDKIKLFGMALKVTLADRAKFRAVSGELKLDDNVWICGEAVPLPEGKGVAVRVTHLLRQPPDLQKYESQIAQREKKNDCEGLLETGCRIDQLRRNRQVNFDSFDRLRVLRNKAFEKGLALKEEALRRDDADGLFALAQQWRELLQNHSKFRACVEKCLKIDPDHPRAGLIAKQELGLSLFEGKWLREEQIKEIRSARSLDQERQTAAQKAAQEARQRAQAQAVSDRPRLLARHQLALQKNDPQARGEAVLALGGAAGNSQDSGFGESAVELLAGIKGAEAVQGLEASGRSGFPEVRRRVLEILVWRGRQQDAAAWDALPRVLAAEKDAETARAAVDALTALGGPAAVRVLVQSMAARDRAVCDEISDGLRLLTRQNISTREGWEAWWSKNQSQSK